MRRLIQLGASVFLVLLVAGCGGDAASPEASSTAGPRVTAAATATSLPFLQQLSEPVRERVEAASWYNDGNYGSAGANLLNVIATGGPLWRDEDSLALLEAHPDGIRDEDFALAKTYARMTLTSVQEVILDDWIVDGVDDYERAVIDAARERPISIAALRKAVADGLFRGTYEANPGALTSLHIDAIGSLSGRVLDLLESENWFADGIDGYEQSLLNVLNTLLSVDEQIRLLQSDNHRPLPLSDRSVAAVYLGDNQELIERAHSIAAAWMSDLEAFVGEFRPAGLVFDTNPDSEADACHVADGGGNRPGRVVLPADYCYQTQVLIHELAHAFIGGRYPTWFAEGVAEMVAYHFTGTRAGYVGGQGNIELEGRYLVVSQPYGNQAALGADFLEALYEMAGPEETSLFLKDVSGRTMGGEAILARIREMQVPDRTALEDLIADAFGLVLASP